MKLTNDDRNAFVRAVMDDVPQIDYQKQAADLVLVEAVKKLPPKVAALWADKTLRPYVAMCQLGHAFGYAEVPCHPDVTLNLPKDVLDAVGKLTSLRYEQQSARNVLKSKVLATIKGCNTLKQAKAALPEFEKYLPKERESTGVGNLPAVANLVADLTKAGWPKGKQGKQGK